MEYDPHQMIESILIAKRWPIDSHAGYIYIRGEYRYQIRDHGPRSEEEAYAKGLSVGKNIAGTGFQDFDLYTLTPARAPMSAAKKPRCSIHDRREARHPAYEASLPGGRGSLGLPDPAE